jgi:UDP-N-acetylmuramoylalanine--D-glutamate ligase
MQEAVLAARQSAKRGEIVLLSPACASFDWFTNYEHRGRVFKETVLSL